MVISDSKTKLLRAQVKSSSYASKIVSTVAGASTETRKQSCGQKLRIFQQGLLKTELRHQRQMLFMRREYCSG